MNLDFPAVFKYGIYKLKYKCFFITDFSFYKGKLFLVYLNEIFIIQALFFTKTHPECLATFPLLLELLIYSASLTFLLRWILPFAVIIPGMNI